MAHKTLIGGTAYTIKGGKDLINGTSYAKKQGKVLVAGTKMSIPFSSGIPLSTVTPGGILMLNENGSPVPFYICKHDYESGLNGAGRTLLVRKDCYDERRWNSSDVNAYVPSDIDSWLNSTYKNMLGADVRAAIDTIKIKYTPGNGNSTVGTLERAIFLLSVTELGKTASSANTEGSALPIANTLQIAYRNGATDNQWTRTPAKSSKTNVYFLGKQGTLYVYSPEYSDRKGNGSRPAFTLPGTLGVEQNADGTYSIAENTK